MKYLHTFRNMSLAEIDRIIDECGYMVVEINRSGRWITVQFPSEEDYHNYVTRPITGGFHG